MGVKLRELAGYLAGALNERGLAAVTAYPDAGAPELSLPVVSVGVKRMENNPAGFDEYMGELYNEATAEWRELYGRRIAVVFALDMYSRRGAAEDCAALADSLFAALPEVIAPSLRLLTATCGEPEPDASTGLMRLRAELSCTTMAYSEKISGGEFTDFEIRPEIVS